METLADVAGAEDVAVGVGTTVGATGAGTKVAVAGVGTAVGAAVAIAVAVGATVGSAVGGNEASVPQAPKAAAATTSAIENRSFLGLLKGGSYTWS